MISIYIFSFMNINREIDITCIIEKSKILLPSSSTGNSVSTLKTLLPGVIYGKQKRESVREREKERKRDRQRDRERQRERMRERERGRQTDRKR